MAFSTLAQTHDASAVQVPFYFKHVVDTLADPGSADMAAATSAAVASPLVLLAAFGCARIAASLMNEARNAVFAKVTQGAIRKVSNKV
jgi:hypothetical protein